MTPATQLKVGSLVGGLENCTNQNAVPCLARIGSETVGSKGVIPGKVTIPPGVQESASPGGARIR
jgi:uncharacterized RmlC-like cupin family protein